MRVLSSDFVLPISSEPIYHGSVAVRGDKIVGVGTRDDIVKLFGDFQEENFGASVILPGFVNCHSHLEITAMRGLLDDVEDDFVAWLLRLNDTRANLSEHDTELAATVGAVEGARSGVTCFADVGRFGRAGFEALAAAGLRGVVFQETNFSPDERTAEKDFYELAEKIRLLRNEETPLVHIGVSPHAPYTVSAKLFSLIAGYAAAENLKISIHAAESKEELRLMQNGTGFFTGVYEKFGLNWVSPSCSSVEFLEHTGILKLKPLLAHCINVSAADIDLIGKHGAAVAHCPKSNAKFGHGSAPFEMMLDAGVAVGLGSDSVASNNMCDMLDEARFAALGARNRPQSSRFVTAKEALEAATLGGAKAVGFGDIIGSLEPGKQADITVISLDSISQAPVNNIHAALVHSSCARDVTATVVAGRDVYRNGKSTMIDEKYLAAQIEKIRRKIQS